MTVLTFYSIFKVLTIGMTAIMHFITYKTWYKNYKSSETSI